MGSSISALQIFQVLRYGAMLLVSVALAKSNWDITTIGAWESILLISGLTSFWWIGGLFNALVPLYTNTPSAQRPQLWTGARWCIIGLSILTVGGLEALRPLILGWFGDEQPLLADHYLLLLIYVGINIPAYLSEYYLLLNQRNRQLIIHALLMFVLQLAAVAALPLMGYGLRETLLGLIIFAGLKLLSVVIWEMRYPISSPTSSQPISQAMGEDLGQADKIQQVIEDATQYEVENWPKKLLSLAAPLMLALLLGGLSTYIDGLIVLNKMGMEAFAIFQYGAKELPVVLVMANALSTAAAAGIAQARDRTTGIADIRERSLKMIHFFFPLSVLLMVASHRLYPLVFSDGFAESAAIFNIYLLLLISRLLFPQTILTGLQQNKIQLFSALVEVCLNVSLSLILLPYYGLVGVAFATVVAHLFDKIFLMGYLWRKHAISPGSYADLGTYSIYASLLAGVCYWTTNGGGF